MNVTAGSRQSVAKARLDFLPLASLRPMGWLADYLQMQKRGLTGNLHRCGYPYDTPGWMSPQISDDLGADKGWGPYEQTGYWMDALVTCGHLLGDTDLLARPRQVIRHVLEHAESDGYLGPHILKHQISRWPHVPFFRALMAEHSASGDPAIVQALRRHYLSNTSNHDDGRDVCNVEIMLWVYEKSADTRLLKMAVRAYEQYAIKHAKDDCAPGRLRTNTPASIHGVTYNEIAKLPAILHRHTGKVRYLKLAQRAYQKIDQHHMLVDGVCSSMEELKGKDPLDGHETCDIADYTWSVGYLLQAIGDARYADRIERACFNAAPGAVDREFKSVQYFSYPNQVLADTQSNPGLYQRGTDWSAYLPQHEVQCCPGDVNRIMPNFAARMWMRRGRHDIMAALYSPGQVTFQPKPAAPPVVIRQVTQYPFSDIIDFHISTPKPQTFSLWLRIPGWCSRASISINEGAAQKVRSSAGNFVQVRRRFVEGDRVRLQLPMRVKLSRWPRGGVAVERGPLVFSLAIGEKWQPTQARPGTDPQFPAWTVHPATDWNFALALDSRRLDQQINVEQLTPTDANPWTPQGAPLALRVPVRRVLGWRLDTRKKIVTDWYEKGVRLMRTRRGSFNFTPQLPDPKTLSRRLGKRLETATLLPYGCTRLRLTIFPSAER